MGTPDRSRLDQLAAELREEHSACETALRNAAEHAFRAGELLLEAKRLLPHGAWGPWLEENFAGSGRTARGYMQLAREADRRTIANIGVHAALAALAAPQAPDDPEAPAEGEVEVVDAEPVPERGRTIVGGREELERAAEELAERAEEEARQREKKFPRKGVEYKTWLQIREAASNGERYLSWIAFREVSNWTVAEALDTVARHYRNAAEDAAALARFMREDAAELPRFMRPR